MAEIARLIDQAKQDRAWHKSRGAAGQIEALACAIRIRALEDALRAIERGG